MLLVSAIGVGDTCGGWSGGCAVRTSGVCGVDGSLAGIVGVWGLGLVVRAIHGRQSLEMVGFR